MIWRGADVIIVIKCTINEIGLIILKPSPTPPPPIHGKIVFYKTGSWCQKFWGFQFSRLVMSNSLRPCEPQHARPPCPSPTPDVYSNSCHWCHPTIPSSVIPFYSSLHSSPPRGSFQMSHFFKSGGQSIGVSASTSVFPMNIQDWFLYDGLVGSPWSPRDSQEFSPTPQFKSINSSVLSFLHSPTLTSIHDYWKNHSFD